MKPQKLRKGQKATIYHDPFTCEKVEDTGKLINCISRNKGIFQGHLVQVWMVRFENEPTAPLFIRTILSDVKYNPKP